MSIIRHQHRNTTNQHGFALVVVATLFIAFAVIAAVAVERNATVQLITKRDSAAEQLTRLSNAIIEYAVFNQSGGTLVYPCPARVDLDPTDANFGFSVQTPNATYADCAIKTSDVTGPPATTVSGYLSIIDTGTTDVVQGMIPVQTLSQYGLSVNDVFDPWNNRILYVVNRQLTKGGTLTNTNNPTVTDVRTVIPNGTPTGNFAPPDFILISLGRDGVGGTRRDSTTISIACTTGTTKARFENCDADSSFAYSPTYTAASAGDTTYFDDILSFYRQ